MATIRVQKNKDYSVINNTGLNDSNLSFKAKGILAYLLSKPDNWTCQVQDLSKNSTDGRDAIYSGLKELRTNGYLIKRPIRIKGKVSEWEEILFETPNTEAISIYKEQEIKNETAALKRAETIKKKKINPLTENTDVDLTISGKSVNGNTVNEKAVNITNTNLPNTNLPSTNLLVVEAEQLFEDNICKLKKTTKTQFEKYCTNYDVDFIMATIELCAEINTESFAGFKTIISGYIDKGIITKQDLKTYVAEYRSQSKKLRDKERAKREARANKKPETYNTKSSNFNNFEQRTYDFEDLERKLLGWDND